MDEGARPSPNSAGAAQVLSRVYKDLCARLTQHASRIERKLPSLDLNDPTVDADVLALFDQAVALLDALRVLQKWIYPEPEPLTFKSASEMIPGLREIFVGNHEDVRDVFQRLQKRPVGRPHKRHLYLAIFDLMLQGADVSLGKARRKISPTLCREDEPSLKAGIRELKNLLRIYAPELVLRFETLHPDRALKSMGKKTARNIYRK